MRSKFQNTWRQPSVPKQIVVENLGDIERAFATADPATIIRLWSPPSGAGIHGVLWFVALQQLAQVRFPDQPVAIVLDCGDRADFAHAALREGLKAICFRGSPGMLAKLRQIAETTGAIVETRHPALPD